MVKKCRSQELYSWLLYFTDDDDEGDRRMRFRFITIVILTVIVAVTLFANGCTQAVPGDPEETNSETETTPVGTDSDPILSEPEEPSEPELPGLIMVSIGNNPNARPQSGLEIADAVYEVLAEGGITRLMAMFYSKGASEIGPVRSIRYCMVEIALGYDSPFAHAGGNADALVYIRDIRPKSLDEIYGAGQHFWRITERTMPDNLYTSTEKLLEGAYLRDYGLSPLTGFPMGEMESGSSATKVEVAFFRSQVMPNIVTYEYKDGVYQRFINDNPNVVKSGGQLAPVNLLFLETETETVIKEELQLDIKVTGEGRAILIRNGRVIPGKWHKDAPASPFSFMDENGQEFTFGKGLTWVHLVPNLNVVSYQ